MKPETHYGYIGHSRHHKGLFITGNRIICAEGSFAPAGIAPDESLRKAYSVEVDDAKSPIECCSFVYDYVMKIMPFKQIFPLISTVVLGLCYTKIKEISKYEPRFCLVMMGLTGSWKSSIAMPIFNMHNPHMVHTGFNATIASIETQTQKAG